MRSVTLGVVIAITALSAPDPARAQKKGVIAPLNPLGISPQDARKVQRWITAAAASIPKHRWLSSSRLARVLQQAQFRDCLAEVSCLASAGRRVGADIVVAGDVGSLSGAFMVYLKLVDRTGTMVRTVNGVLDPKKRGLRDTVRGLVFQLLSPEEHVGTIEVKVDVPNAWIYLDGHRVARSPRGTLEGIKVGTHALRVTHEAYRDFVRFVKVGFRETQQVKVELSAFPVGSGQMKLVGDPQSRPLTSSEMPWYRRWWAVVGFGAVVLAATTTAVALLANRSISSDSEVVVPP
jgi:hypothetical protein